MFLSTIVTSSKFDYLQNLDTTPYKFTVPYNFVRGKNIIIDVIPKIIQDSIVASYDYLVIRSSTLKNRLNVLLPDNVNLYSIDRNFYFSGVYGSGGGTLSVAWTHKVTIIFDIINNYITFVPTGTTPLTGDTVRYQGVNAYITTPVLLTISTILDTV